jgi:hypothetical protein
MVLGVELSGPILSEPSRTVTVGMICISFSVAVPDMGSSF